MHTLFTADVAREIVADRLRTADDHRLAKAVRRGEDTTASPRPRRRFARLRRVRVAIAH